MTVLKLTGVQYEYKLEGQNYAALKDVNLEIQAGEFVAIVGPSGSGKSTLLNILGLLSRPTAGAFEIFGQSVESLSDEQLAENRNTQLGFVFQSFSLIARLSVMENVLLPSDFSRTASDEEKARLTDLAKSLLIRFGLGELVDRYPNELSGGQKQRVAICRALLMNPQMLLADEPTGALDSKSAGEVLKVLKQIHTEGKTVVVITHDPDVASHAERIIEVRNGEVFSQAELPPAPTQIQANLNGNQKPAPTSRLNIYKQSIVLAKRSLLTHRVRSALTGLGLFVGILSLVIIDGLGEIVQTAFNKLFYTSSIRKAYIYFDDERGGFHRRRNSGWQGLHAKEEFPQVARMFEKKGNLRPFLRSETCQIKTETGEFRSRLVGVSDSAEFTEMDTDLSVGRFPSSSEFISGTQVVVLGSDTVSQLFSQMDPRRREPGFPIGQKVIVDNCNTLAALTVVGVMQKRDTSFGNRDANDVLYVPTQTLLQRMGPTFYTWFSILPHEGVDTRTLAQEVTSFLKLRSGGKLNFGSSIPADILDRVRGFLRIIQAIVGFIGALCLFVGGVGIMNMMLVTVAERTREIGIMKSLGAQQVHIKSYILTEATLLCAISGVFATVAGFAANNIFSFGVSLFVPMLKEFNWIWAPLGLTAGLAVSFLCGLGFGYLPASKAAALDPAECLRAE
jgi:macrolide transport system ATP-binding/permease protein